MDKEIVLTKQLLLIILVLSIAVLVLACEDHAVQEANSPLPLEQHESSDPTQGNELGEEAESTEEQEENDSDIVEIFTPAYVSRVVDGDTIEVVIKGEAEKVRLVGINTPESTTRHEPYGEEASKFTKEQLTEKTVYLEIDTSNRDRYGRLLRLVWVKQPEQINDETIRAYMFNAKLCLDGYAEVSTYAPDVKYAKYFQQYTREAREANLGLWALRQDEEGDTPVVSVDSQVKIISVDAVAEIVGVENISDSAVELTGWKLISVLGDQTYNFPEGFRLAAGAQVEIVSGRKAPESDGVSVLKWSGEYIWNNQEVDPAELYNSEGELVSYFR